MFSKWDTVSYKGQITEVIGVDSNVEAMVMIVDPTDGDRALFVPASELTLVSKYR